MMGDSLRGRTALITGAAIRLGRAMALGLAERGANIVLHYHQSPNEAKQTAEDVRNYGVECHVVQADLTDPVPESERIFDRLEQSGVFTDVLVNSASLFEKADLFATTETQWDRQFALNLKAPFFLASQFALRLRSRAANGSIVNICDWRGLRPIPGHDAYTLTKAGLVAMTQMLAVELAPSIRVNGIAPGAILPTAGDTTEHAKRGKERVPLRKTGDPADIVRTLLFLLESPFITGEVISVDGGEGM